MSCSALVLPAAKLTRCRASDALAKGNQLIFGEIAVEFARYLVKEVGVAAVPGTSFYNNAAAGRTKLRFCFCKRDETLREADRRMEKLVPAAANVSKFHH